jgi:hypothetical protein
VREKEKEREKRERKEREKDHFQLFVKKILRKKKITVKLVKTFKNAIFLYIGHYSSKNSDNQFFFIS